VSSSNYARLQGHLATPDKGVLFLEDQKQKLNGDYFSLANAYLKMAGSYLKVVDAYLKVAYCFLLIQVTYLMNLAACPKK
jgi:hypothetical protein